MFLRLSLFFCIAILLKSCVSSLEIPNVKIIIGPVQPEPFNRSYSSYIAFHENHTDYRFSFDMTSPYSCIPTHVKAFKAHAYNRSNDQIQLFRLPLVITNLDPSDLHLLNADIVEQYSKQNLKSFIEYLPQYQDGNIQPHKKLQLNIVHQCESKMHNENYWTVNKLILTFTNKKPIDLEYQFICDELYRPRRFDWSNLILIFLECISIIFLARFGRIFAIKLIIHWSPPQIGGPSTLEDDHIFQGFFLNFFHSILYIALAIVNLWLALRYESQAEKSQENGIQIFCFIFVAYFFDEVFCSMEIKPFTHRIVCFRLCDLLSLMISALIISFYIIFEKPWFLSDLITFCMLGSLVKIFKIKSIKDGVKFYAPILLMDIAVSIYLSITIRYEWDNVAMKYFNTPLSAQLPYFYYQYKRKCGWISFFNILFPGKKFSTNVLAFFVGYSYRFDACKRTFVYEIISFFGLFCGMVLWVVFQVIFTLPLPMYDEQIFILRGIFSGLPMIGLTILISFQRGEFKGFWQGMFYDSLILNPFGDSLIKKEDICDIHLYRVIQIKKKVTEQQADPEQQEQQNNELVQQNRSGKFQFQDNLFEGLDNKKF